MVDLKSKTKNTGMNMRKAKWKQKRENIYKKATIIHLIFVHGERERERKRK
jgi:hypothetical protein